MGTGGDVSAAPPLVNPAIPAPPADHINRPPMDAVGDMAYSNLAPDYLAGEIDRLKF